MRIADVLTGSRVVATPFVIWLVVSDQMLAAYYLFGAAAVTDLLDGYFARRSTRKVEYGANFDGLADFALVFGTIFAVASRGEAFWLLIAGVTAIAIMVAIFGLISKNKGRLTIPHIDTSLLAAFVYPAIMLHIIDWKFAEVFLAAAYAVALGTAANYGFYIRRIYRSEATQ